jgi:hypothetical protein
MPDSAEIPAPVSTTRLRLMPEAIISLLISRQGKTPQVFWGRDWPLLSVVHRRIAAMHLTSTTLIDFAVCGK